MPVAVEDVLAGNRLALARLLSEIENDSPEGRQALNDLFPHSGRAALIGVTGAPGTGKSSLVNQIAYHYRHPVDGQQPKRVAVVAVDPSSPFSGGAVLGDRIRMHSLSGDPDVFIRSMASRGSLGGLARTTAGLVQAFDAAGYEIILIETVGAGQAEVEIARLAHTTLVVEAPGLGDDVQAIKAGILEIADILVVNKADRPGVEQTERALRGMLQLAHPGKREYHHGRLVSVAQPEEPSSDEPAWVPPIQRTTATDGVGVPDLLGLIEDHRDYLKKTGELSRREAARLTSEVDLLVQAGLVDQWRSGLDHAWYQQVLVRVMNREISPRQAAAELTGAQSEERLV